VTKKHQSALKGSSSSDIGLQQAGKQLNGGKSKSVLFNPNVDEAIVDEASVISLPSDSNNSPIISKSTFKIYINHSF